MGLFGAGFSAVGVGHLRIGARTRGLGEVVAGAGAIVFGLSFLVTPSIVPFVAGVSDPPLKGWACWWTLVLPNRGVGRHFSSVHRHHPQLEGVLTERPSSRGLLPLPEFHC